MTTSWAARNVYSVVYDEKTLRLDEEGTRAAREARRAERLRKAKPFDEFEEEWRRLRPPDSVIRSYGNYPNPSQASVPSPEEQ